MVTENRPVVINEDQWRSAMMSNLFAGLSYASGINMDDGNTSPGMPELPWKEDDPHQSKPSDKRSPLVAPRRQPQPPTPKPHPTNIRDMTTGQKVCWHVVVALAGATSDPHDLNPSSPVETADQIC